MALVLADLGADQILKAYFNNDFPASKNWKLRLFTNDYTPVDTSTLGSYTQASGGGYGAIDLSNGSWTVTPANDPSDAVYAEQTFTFTGALSGNATIYGYYIEDNAGSSGVAVYGERLATSFTPANNGDTLKITPKFQMSKGTPT
jgi:hypothetical protein